MQALGTPRRQEILRLVWDQERSVGDIHRAFGDLTVGAVSQHLRVLRDAGLVTAREDRQRRLYIARKVDLGPFHRWLEESWGSALYRLKIRAELEEARRGPRSAARSADKGKNRTRRKNP